MEEFLKGVALGAIVGACVAGVMVAKNKKLSSKIRQGLSDMEDKMAEAKETLTEKLQECDCFSGETKSDCGFCVDSSKVNSQNKKSKN